MNLFKNRFRLPLIPRSLAIITLGAIAVYLFFLFFPAVHWIIFSGVDSWTYGIAKLQKDGWLFGSDLIYTYGPFGYLSAGSAFPETFNEMTVFKVVVHATLLVLAAIRLWQIESAAVKTLFGISILCAYHPLFALDYHIIFIFLILLSWKQALRGKRGRWVAIGLGGLAGFFALIKFTAGVIAFGSLFLVLLGNVYTAWQQPQSRQQLQRCSWAIFDATTAAMTVSFLGLHPNLGLGLGRLAIPGAIALVWGGMGTYLQPRLRLFWGRYWGWNSSLEIFGLVTAMVVLTTEMPSLRGFILRSLAVSSGYTSAMSLVGSSQELALALMLAVSILILFVSLATSRSLGWLLALTFVLWIAFKHGFVRQDLHVYLFFFILPFLLALALSDRETHHRPKLELAVPLLVFAVLIFYTANPKAFGQTSVPWNLYRLGNPQFVWSQTRLLDFPQVFREIEAANQRNLKDFQLSQNVRSYLARNTVDVFPWELTLVPANQLNWQPRPTLQSYTAYTTSLDRWNVEIMEMRPPQFLLYDFAAIDGRHPFFSEPATFFHLLSHYRLSADFPEFVPTPLLPNLMLLEERDRPLRSLATSSPRQKTLAWNTPLKLQVTDGELLRASVKIKASIWGKISKTILRSPPVRLRVRYVDNREATYRILPSNSENGVLLSHLPRNPDEGWIFWTQLTRDNPTFPAAVASIMFETDRREAYASNIELELTSLRLQADESPN